jgi:hypothetical protein
MPCTGQRRSSSKSTHKATVSYTPGFYSLSVGRSSACSAGPTSSSRNHVSFGGARGIAACIS